MTLEPNTIVDALATVLGKPAVLHEPALNGNEWDYVKECLDTGWVSTAGKYVDTFEGMLADITGARHAVATVDRPQPPPHHRLRARHDGHAHLGLDRVDAAHHREAGARDVHRVGVRRLFRDLDRKLIRGLERQPCNLGGALDPEALHADHLVAARL